MLKMVSLIPVLSRTPNLLKELRNILPNVKFHEVVNPETDQYFKNSEIVIGDFDLLGPFVYTLTKAKWVSGTWAGIDKLVPFIEKNKPIPYQLTRFTGEHFGKIMSEYVITNIVNHERNFYEMKTSQSNQQWNRNGKISNYRIISDMTIGILGVGNIGNRIGNTLSMLGAKILAFGRRSTLPNTNEYHYVTKYHTKDSLSDLLQNSDYIINVLPKTNETNGLLNGDILRNCQDKQSVLVNIGRSNIISEQTIIEALDKKWLSAVILDVFDVEPLPSDNVLWQMEQVFITPHVAGMSRAKDIAELFKSNLELYHQKQRLPAVVDFESGY